jgi:hypothetical protein
MRTIAEMCEKHGSQGGKAVTCVRCSTDIPPYAGRRVAAYSDRYAHHPGQCADAQRRQDTLRSVTDQPGLFAWQCTHIEPGDMAPVICSEASGNRGDYAQHMRGHGAQQLHPTQPIIRLRKSVPAAKRQVPAVPAFKRIEWTERHYADWQPGIGNERLPDTEHRGQFWANGPDAHSVIVIEDMRGTGRPNRLVTLYLDASGQLVADWSDAKHSRRDANRAERDRKFYSSAA